MHPQSLFIVSLWVRARSVGRFFKQLTTHIMERIYVQFERYSSLNEEIKQDLTTLGKIKRYNKGSYYKHEDEAVSKWCFIIQGLVSEEHFNAGDRLVVERICDTNEYFVGTKHTFSSTGEPLAIKFLKPTLLYEIRNSHLQELLDQHDELKAIYHRLVQRKLNQSNRHIHRTNGLLAEERLYDLHLDRPNLIKQLTVEQKSAFLKLANNEAYYKAKRYMDKKLKNIS